MKALVQWARDFVGELRRRRVIRVGVVYAVVAFTVVQVADVFFRALQLPEWTVTFVAALAIVGFPVAVALAWAFDFTAEGLVRTSRQAPPAADAEVAQATGRPAPRAVWFVLGLVVALSGAWFGASQLGLGGGDADLDADLVVVLPFRVAGADAGSQYLREGMVHLLSATLTGEWGPRAVDARTTMVLWSRLVGDESTDLSREEAFDLAERMGAPLVILGDVVANPARLVINAYLLETSGTQVRPPVTVEGPPDSLTVLVDRLAALLLSQEAGEGEHRLASLTSTSLPALRAYLQATADYRKGSFEAALAGYQQALALDSTFALAAMGVIRAAGWTLMPSDVEAAAVAQAWAHRERLSTRDLLYLEALAGLRYPEVSTARDQLAAWERVAERYPEDPEAWYQVGDAYFHHPTLLGEESEARARAAFTRAVELDPQYAPALLHLADLATVMSGDPGEVRPAVEQYLAVDSLGFYARLVRINANRVLGNVAEERRLREELRALDFTMLLALSMVFPAPGIGPEYPWGEVLETGELAQEAARGVAGTAEERRTLAREARSLALNRGRLDDARAALNDLRAAGADPLEPFIRQVEDALYWDADPAEAAQAAEALTRALGSPSAWVERTTEGPWPTRAVCALEQWRLSQGDASSTPQAVEALRGPAQAPGPARDLGARVCVELLGAWSAHVRGDPDAEDRVRALEAFLAQGQPGAHATMQATLALSRILEARGDLTGAAKVAGWQIFLPSYLHYVSTLVRTEAAMAARSGDMAHARDRYGVYLAMVSDPAPGSPAEQEARRAREFLEADGGT